MTNEPTNDSDKHRLYKLNWLATEQRLYNLSWLAANRISVYRGSRCYDVWLHGTSSRGC